MRKRQNPFDYWESVFTIKEQLRRCHARFNSHPGQDVTAIHADRASGKTVALVQFVAERMLSVDMKDKIAVLIPMESIECNFSAAFMTHFPTLPLPLIFSAQRDPQQIISAMMGEHIDEVYVEEMFLIPFKTIDHLRQASVPLVAGVGTLHGPAIVVAQW